MDLHRIGIKFFAEEANAIMLDEFIPLFHHWIQRDLLNEDVLLDVSSYSHVHDGAGTLLVAHQGNYAYDETFHRRGLIYYNKRDLAGNLPEKIAVIARKALQACRLIEQSEEMKGRVSFNTGELCVYSNDRLLAPNTDETHRAWLPVIEPFLERLYPGSSYEAVREADPRERYSLIIKVSSPETPDTLLQRLEL